MPKIMLEHRRLVGQLKAGVLSAALLVPSVALAGAKDKPATALANDAMQTEYAGTHFKKAEQKLKKAITLCGASGCAYDVVGRLHRDLAIVYIAGLKQNGKGKAELKRALTANPDLTLDNDFTTPDVRKAFVAAGGKEPKVEEEVEETAPQTKKKDDDCEPGSDGCDKEVKKEEPPSPPSKSSKNWLSVNFDQDFLLYSAKDNVCASNAAGRAEAAQWTCFRGGSQFGYAPGQDIASGAGNHVSGGVGRATSRVLVGFDRLLGSNVSLGLRLGFAFGGGPTTNAGVKFLPFSAEGRVNYWFGRAPFESSGLRPYASLSGGMAEVDGHVQVQYYDTAGTKNTLEAWRKTGKGFAGFGLGMMIPIGSSGITPEVRLKQMLGSSATAFDLALGYAYGF